MPDHDPAAAAERLRDGFNYAQCPDHWDECNDARLLAAAYLDLTDPTPIDDATLLAFGFTKTGSSDYPFWRSQRSSVVGPACRIGYEPRSGCDGWMVGSDAWQLIPPVQSVGQLRMLCLALSIPLTAAPRPEQQ